MPMFKAEIGDLLYIIIFAILILLGGLEKIFKAKRQPQQDKTPAPPQPYDDFEDVDEQSPHTEPQSLEDVMKRMLQTLEGTQEEDLYPKMRPKEVIPEELPLHLTSRYQPVCDTFGNSEKTPFPKEEIEETSSFQGIDFEFDARQAVIASEILNRKY